MNTSWNKVNIPDYDKELYQEIDSIVINLTKDKKDGVQNEL